MKKFLLATVFLFAVAFSFAQSPVKFKQTRHAFGTVAQGKPVTTVFNFVNTTKKPVIIETAMASCGCTTPKYPKAPILPGKKGTIEVSYDAAVAGHFNKSVTVKFAGVEQPVLLFVEGDVTAKK